MGNLKNKNKHSHIKKNENSLGIGFFVVPLIILAFLFALIFSLMEDGVYIYISPVIKNYEPLEKTEDEPIDNYFIDEIGLFYDEERHYLVNDSVEYLYDKTGVKVFVWGIPASIDEEGNQIFPTDEEAEQTCKATINSLSKHGIDLVILYIPTDVGYVTHTYATDEVRDVYGNKLEKLLEQYLDYNFHVVGEYDELFYYSYRQTADRIMGGFTSPLAVIKENLRFFILSSSTLVVIISSLIFYKRFERR